MRIVAAFLCLAAAALADVTPPQKKQPATPLPPGECPEQQAREMMMDGMRHYADGEYELATAAFLQAYACRPATPVLLNIAQSYRKARQPCVALAWYRRFLHDAPSSLAASEATARIREIEQSGACKP